MPKEKATGSFGYKTAWLAIASTDSARVVQALGLSWVQRADADPAMYDAIRDGRRIFVTPPVRGWTLCTGWPLMEQVEEEPDGSNRPRLFGLIERLSRQLGCEVQYFLSDRRAGYAGWARATGGELRRAYLYLSEIEDGDSVIIEHGAPTPEERAFEELTAPPREGRRIVEDDGEFYPGELEVPALAGRWSVDPTELVLTERGHVGSFGPWWKLW